MNGNREDVERERMEIEKDKQDRACNRRLIHRKAVKATFGYSWYGRRSVGGARPPFNSFLLRVTKVKGEGEYSRHISSFFNNRSS